MPGGVLLTCFLNRIALYLSKSFNVRLRALCARLLAQELLSHFESTSAFSHAALTAPFPAALGNFLMTIGVRVTWERAAPWRGTNLDGDDEGPSTRIYGRDT